MFGSIFGKKKTESTVSKSSTVRAPATSPQATIVELNKSVETQEKREKLLEKKMKDCVETARQKKAKGDKTGEFRKKMRSCAIKVLLTSVCACTRACMLA